MAEATPPPAERLVAAYKRLAVSAETLNAASKEFAEPIAQIDDALQRLNLGLITWERIHGSDDDGYGNYWSRDVGYAKVDRKWGLAIRTTEGNHNAVDSSDIEEWLFNDAPRSYRIEAIDKVPDLVEKLIRSADKTARKLKEKSAEARELAAALSGAAKDVEQQRKPKGGK